MTDRAQVLDLIFKSQTERVASPLESTIDGLGDIVHRFEVSDGNERRGIIITVTQLTAETRARADEAALVVARGRP